jgi:hypothetical protein
VKVLLDECVDWRLSRDITGHDVKTARHPNRQARTRGPYRRENLTVGDEPPGRAGRCLQAGRRAWPPGTTVAAAVEPRVTPRGLGRTSENPEKRRIKLRPHSKTRSSSLPEGRQPTEERTSETVPFTG